MKQPKATPLRPRASDDERWEYILLAGTNRPPEPKAPAAPIEDALRLFGSTRALVFLAVVALAPQTPGAHNWAAERAASQAAGVTAPLAP